MGETNEYRLNFSKDILKHKHIIYGGDSFTWGEGLELYIDTPFWINERNNHNEWGQLESKQTHESHLFRSTHRFPGIIESIAGYKQVVDPVNGGDYQSSTDIINYNLNENTTAIIYQFTSIDRNFLHSTINCECDFCRDEKPKPFNVYLNYINKILNNEKISDWMQSKIDYLERYENIKKFSISELEKSGLDFGMYIDSLFADIRKRNIDYLIENNIKKWQAKHKVYLIDSWCHETSPRYIHSNPYLVNLLLPLKGYDGNWYTKYQDWERTFPHTRIMYQYPNTVNGHPTPIQHQYLAESILTALEKDGISTNIKII
jgi:hypothetical protein